MNRCLTARSAAAALILGYSLLAGCSSRDGELNSFIETTKGEPGGRVEPLPEVKPYDSFVYGGGGKRSPFLPGGTGAGSNPLIRPTTNRTREFLEQFSLDTLKMVGTLNIGGRPSALVQVKDGRVHRVEVGNYIGQSDGRVTDISANKVTIMEVVPDGLGGYMQRPAAIGLSE
jgi:type IV pilus assembly protein PilP